MYARYIPPRKVKEKEQTSGPQDSSTQAQQHAPPNTMRTSSATPYARYIPPPKVIAESAVTQQPRKIVFDEDDTTRREPRKIVFNEVDAPRQEPKKKRKRDGGGEEADVATRARSEKKAKKSELRGKDIASDASTLGKDPAPSGQGVLQAVGQEGPNGKVVKEKSKSKSGGHGVDTAAPGDIAAASVTDASVATEKPGKEKKTKEKSGAGRSKKISTMTEEANRDSKDHPLSSLQGSAESGLPQQDKSPAAAVPIAGSKVKNRKGSRSKKTPEENRKDGSEVAENQDKINERHTAVLRRKVKSLQRAEKAAEIQELSVMAEPDSALELSQNFEEPEEVHGLEPIPQPAPATLETPKPAYETLPLWLASPIRVPPGTSASFTDLGISSDAAAILDSKGYKAAFAVQVVVLPLLLPSPERQGDLVISAATGSGKTLAYVLPMVKDVSQSIITRLRGLIIVPSRELVKQAQEVCETCAAAFATGGGKRVKIGTSVGNQAFVSEQAALMEETQRYDPGAYKKYVEKRGRAVSGEDSDSETESYLFRASTKSRPDHVVEHQSRVDVLICTPGRLVEHLTRTPGFTLDYVRWLVVDEADKLLAQSFQQWLDVVMGKLSMDGFGARDFPGSNKTGIRKVVLSATMTRDLSLLNGLKLCRPQLIVLEGGQSEEQESTTAAGEHTLPELLKEFAIRVRDSNLKPLYLIELLKSQHLARPTPDSEKTDAEGRAAIVEDGLESSASSSLSDTDADTGSDSDSSVDTTPTPAGKQPFQSSVLIFARSNEAALRLSRLLSLLSPDLTHLVGTLTSTTRTSRRRKTLQAFAARKLRVLVASDLVARGIDLTSLDHVVNYDMPASVAAYVHRVGRTARAGRAGRAWTLVAYSEAAWFWREIAGEGKGAPGTVRRAGRVERVTVGGGAEDGGFGEGRERQYEDALEQLGREAAEMRRKKA